ncbi:DivIVA domain-containing protein [Streptacidiphilus melanogenes]|uniref:DivIVA domain-containing protein n=1 Tax=Streptacidiphilus melanogenes TaxID=411235 RepID=UPI0007C805D8|nr:DivIVA domain-containing protein [Streptacidiphilus melanogenes]
MFWLILVLMVLVVGAAALAALGAGGSLPEAERDRLAARLPQDRPLSRTDVDDLRFPMSLRGYRMDEVDDALDRMAAELSEREHRVQELETALAAALASPGAAGSVAAEQRSAYQPTQVRPPAKAPAEPSVEPTVEPSVQPFAEPSAESSAEPSAESSVEPPAEADEDAPRKDDER